LLRLPPCIHDIEFVVLGQSTEVFSRAGFRDIESWDSVTAPARRRRCFFNRSDTLACFVASVSDIDDVIPILTAYQIEWNKIHFLLQRNSEIISKGLPTDHQDETDISVLAHALNISVDDILRLKSIWGKDFTENIHHIARNKRNLRVRLLSGSSVPSISSQVTYTAWLTFSQVLQ
jgi:hypothetical protein